MRTLISELTKFKQALPVEQKSSKEIEEQKKSIQSIIGKKKKKEIPEYQFNFGRYKGESLEKVAYTNLNYLKWLMTTEWPEQNEVNARKIKQAIDFMEQ